MIFLHDDTRVQNSVGRDGAVWGIQTTGAIYRFNTQTENWDAISGSLTKIVVASKDEVWGLNAAGSIYRFNPEKQDWELAPGSFKQISVAFDGSVWAVSPTYIVSHYNMLTRQ